MDTFLKKLGDSIRSFRTAQNCTLERLAERADLSPNYLSDIERGQRNLTIRNLEKIARGLNVPVYQLLLGIQPAANDDLLELVALAAHTDAKVTAFITNIVKCIVEKLPDLRKSVKRIGET